MNLIRDCLLILLILVLINFAVKMSNQVECLNPETEVIDV